MCQVNISQSWPDVFQPMHVHIANVGPAKSYYLGQYKDQRPMQFYLNIQGEAQINLQNRQGLSPLHIAANEGHDKMAKLLIENGN